MTGVRGPTPGWHAEGATIDTPTRPATLTPSGDPAAQAVRELHATLGRLTGTTLPLRLWDGTKLGDGSDFEIALCYPWSARALLHPPLDLSAGEAYVEGAIDLVGDVVAAMAAGEQLGSRLPDDRRLRLRLLRQLRRLPPPPRRHHTRRAHLRGRMHSRERDRAAIAFHYDLPQRFYEAFLDPALVYSCAYFADPGEDLAAAQRRKLDLICRKLRLRPGMRLLDIGCGWGSLLIHAARSYGIEGLGVTLSQTQVDAGRQRIAAAGLAGQIEIRLQDYREIDEEFGAVASVGMFEHVGPTHLAEYFSTVWRLTRPGGVFLNHGIVMGDPTTRRSGRERTFVTAYVFPDGGLVPQWQAVREAETAGFEVVDIHQMRPHYALTLRRWLERLEGHHGAAVAAASETDYRIWRAYLAASAHSFDTGALGLVQILCSKDAELPLGREWMLTAPS